MRSRLVLEPLSPHPPLRNPLLLLRSRDPPFRDRPEEPLLPAAQESCRGSLLASPGRPMRDQGAAFPREAMNSPGGRYERTPGGTLLVARGWAMPIGQACLWGLLGAGLIEIRALWEVLHPFRAPKWPWRDRRGRPQLVGYAVAVICRFAMAAGVDAVYAASHQIAGSVGAVTMGVAAPLVIQQMALRAEPGARDAPKITAGAAQGDATEREPAEAEVLASRHGQAERTGGSDAR